MPLVTVSAAGSYSPMPQSHVADRVRTLRTRLGLSQPALAKRAGIDVDNIKKVEVGRNHASTATLQEALARGFGISEHDLRAYLAGSLSVEAVAERAGGGSDVAGTPPKPQEAPMPKSPDNSHERIDAALARAFRSSERFELQDVDAIRKILRAPTGMRRDAADLERVARAWLTAAASLRMRGEAVSIESLMFELASPLERDGLRQRSDDLNGNGDDQLDEISGKRREK